MRTLHKTLVIAFSVAACVVAIFGWALTSDRQTAYHFQGNYEQHG